MAHHFAEKVKGDDEKENQCVCGGGVDRVEERRCLFAARGTAARGVAARGVVEQPRVLFTIMDSIEVKSNVQRGSSKLQRKKKSIQKTLLLEPGGASHVQQRCSRGIFSGRIEEQRHATVAILLRKLLL